MQQSRPGGDAVEDARIREMLLWYELQRLQDAYISLIDDDRLEEWADLFTEDGVYEIVPKENEDRGLPIRIMHCFARSMLRDRVTSLRKANAFEAHSYRHTTTSLQIRPVDADTVHM